MYSTNFGGARKGAGRPPKGTEKRIKVSFTLDQENKETLEQIAKENHNARTYLSSDGSKIHWDMISLALRSPANTAVYPLQDVLGLGSEARMNVPGREEGNWSWRFQWEQLTPEIEQRLHRLTQEANRN